MDVDVDAEGFEVESADTAPGVTLRNSDQWRRAVSGSACCSSPLTFTA